MKRLFLLAFLLLSIVARAQSVNHIGVSATGGKSVTTWHGQMGVAALNIEFAKSLSPRTDIGFMLSPTSVHQPRSWFGNEYGDGDENVRALAGSLLVRHTFGHVYVEGAAGPMWAEKRVPASTSRFNWVTQGGAGFMLLPRSAMPVMIGYRFLHISNGGYAPRNPGVNVSSVVIGTVIRTRR